MNVADAKVKHSIYGTRIARELGQIFGASGGEHEREIQSGLFVSVLRDRKSESLRQARGAAESLPDDVKSQQHVGLRSRRPVTASPSGIPTSQFGDIPAYLGFSSSDEVTFKQGGKSTVQSVGDVDLLCDLTDTPNLLVRWSSETESFKVTSSTVQPAISTSAGLRLLLRFTEQYFESWGVVISDVLLKSCRRQPSPKSGVSVHAGSHAASSSREQLSDAEPTAADVCIALIEIPEEYPMASPTIAVVYLGIQQDLNWYHSIFSDDPRLLRRHLASGGRTSNVAMPQVLVHDALPLTQLSPSHLTRLVLGESWSPAISLDALIVRLSALLREQAISHVYYANVTPELLPLPQEEQTPRVYQETTTIVKESEESYISGSTQQKAETLVTESLTTMTVSSKPPSIHGSRQPSQPGAKPYSFLSLWSVLFISIALRVIIGNQPHSGQYNAPVYGDYEAHRHWKELTINRPVTQWYTHEDPQWNLDYPPLSAFHEWFMGKISQWLEPESVTNTASSRGYLTLSHKLFMRWSVIISDLLVFHTAAIFFWCFLPDDYLSGRVVHPAPSVTSGALFPLLSSTSLSRESRLLCLLLFLCSPPLVLVDHGHFQYNCVALGLVLWAVNFLALGKPSFSVAFYLCAVLHKQTMLYFFPAFLSFYLGFISRRVVYHGWLSQLISRVSLRTIVHRVTCLVGVATSVILAIFSPFVAGTNAGSSLPKVPATTPPPRHMFKYLKLDAVIPIFRRVFPFHRGIFEDYVANVWVSLRPLIKMNQLALTNRDATFLLCTGLAIFFCIPTCIALLRRPTFNRCRYSLVCCSLSFFLWSPQVHEKAILLPLTSALLALPSQYNFSMMFGFIASFSLLHLMIKDYLVPPFVGLLLLWTVAAFVFRPTIQAWGEQQPSDRYSRFKGLTPSSPFRPLHDMSFASFRDVLVDASVFIWRLFSLSDSFNEGLFLSMVSRLFGFSSKSRASFTSLFPRPLWDRLSVQCVTIIGAVILATLQATVSPPVRYPWLHIYIQCVFCCILFVLLGITSFDFLLSSKNMDQSGLAVTKVLLVGPPLSATSVTKD